MKTKGPFFCIVFPNTEIIPKFISFEIPKLHNIFGRAYQFHPQNVSNQIWNWSFSIFNFWRIFESVSIHIAQHMLTMQQMKIDRPSSPDSHVSSSLLRLGVLLEMTASFVDGPSKCLFPLAWGNRLRPKIRQRALFQ